MIQRHPPPFMDLATLAEHICCGESTIEAWVKQGIFPCPVRQGGKRLWQWKEVERHLARQGDKASSLADDAARMRKAMQDERAKAPH